MSQAANSTSTEKSHYTSDIEPASIIAIKMPDALKAPFSGHIPALDGVRGLAILMVLLVHFVASIPPETTFQKILVYVCGYGRLGVELFFVLSGFLITGILLDTKQKDNYFKNFFMRRFLRIFPLYYGVLAVVFWVLPWLPPFQGPTLDGLLSIQGWAWSYLMNVYVALAGAWTHPYITHFWSLAVEEHFYMFWPFVVFYTSRTQLIRVCLGLIAFAYLFRVSLEYLGANAIAISSLTPSHFDGLALGALISTAIRGIGSQEYWLAWLKKYGSLLFVGGAVSLAALLAVKQITPHGTEIFRPLRQSAFLAIFASLLIGALISKKTSLIGAFFGHSWLIFLGKYSYGLYVFHAMVSTYFKKNQTINLFTDYIGDKTIAIFALTAVGTLLSIGISLLCYHGFEKHFLALKVRWDSR